MTLEEIKALITTYTEQVNDPRVYDEDIAATLAALLKAVGELELEAAKADSWRQAAEGFRRERDEAREALKWERVAFEDRRVRLEVAESALSAARAERDAAREAAGGHEWNRLLNERDAFRVRAEAAEKERDEMVAASNEELMRLRAMLSVERDASEGSRRYAKECHAAAATLNDERASAIRRGEAAEAALAATREAMEGLLDSMVTDHDTCALCLRDLSNHASGCPVVAARAALASPPPAALSTETEEK